ncbi:MAG: hypothetical protein IPN46_16995 [Saprospiraceae bacterium]|nr:hypothetical protein [Saprospiraceae bacterium]
MVKFSLAGTNPSNSPKALVFDVLWAFLTFNTYTNDSLQLKLSPPYVNLPLMANQWPWIVAIPIT